MDKVYKESEAATLGGFVIEKIKKNTPPASPVDWVIMTAVLAAHVHNAYDAAARLDTVPRISAMDIFKEVYNNTLKDMSK